MHSSIEKIRGIAADWGADVIFVQAVNQLLEGPLRHKPAKQPNDLEVFFVERANAGDIEGLMALYEPNAMVANGDREVTIGLDQIREYLVRLLESCPQLEPSEQAPALCSGDLALTSSRLRNGDITAEVARRQPDGNWLWVIDQFVLGRAV